MTDSDGALWRDDERLPLSELDKAMGSSTVDGQADDATGNDAGYEAAFGHGPIPADGHTGFEAGQGRRATDEERAYRPSPTGRTGPDV